MEIELFCAFWSTLAYSRPPRANPNRVSNFIILFIEDKIKTDAIDLTIRANFQGLDKLEELKNLNRNRFVLEDDKTLYMSKT